MSELGDDGNEYDLPQCPKCDGFGTVLCHCGGDLCVCDNYGEEECPLCDGEGFVTEATYQRYLDDRRKWAEAIQKARTA